MSSLSSLTAAAMLMPGAMLVEKIGRRRGIVVASGTWSRFAMLIVALLPFILQDQPLIYIAIAFAITRDAMNNLAYPAWLSMTADIVPLEGRGRYFASRNFAMSIAGIVIIFLMGLLITRTGQPLGYQIALSLAFATGCMSVFSFSHLTDRSQTFEQVKAKTSLAASLPALLHDMAKNRDFVTFVSITALWNFSLNIAGPFFTVYLVTNLHADAAMVALTTIATSVSTMLAQRKLGELHDRWGSRKMTIIAGILIPILPLAWSFINAAWMVIPINLLGGALWGAYNLASFNYLLQITPEDRRPRYSAIFQIVVTVSLAIGAALGSLFVTSWGYQVIFLVSFGGRVVAALLFARLSALARRNMQPSTAEHQAAT